MNTERLATASCAMGLLAYVGVTSMLSGPQAAAEPAGIEAPATIELRGLVRDFRERTAPSGHPDFEVTPAHGYNIYCGNISPYLGDDGKPVFTGQGRKVHRNWRDSANRPICYRVAEAYPAPGDKPGEWGPADTGGIESEKSFAHWYRDTPGVNMSRHLTLKLVRQDDDTYVFDNRFDPMYADLGGFFPIEGRLYGKPEGFPERNFHFTVELRSEFVYDPDANQVFGFEGDDDVWVFINGELVIDLGGVHPAKEQFIDLNRLDLEPGETYPLDFFFAERHRTQSNFRIVTTLQLTNVDPPALTSIVD